MSAGMVCKTEPAAAEAVEASARQVHDHVRSAAALGSTRPAGGRSWHLPDSRWRWPTGRLPSVSSVRAAGALHALVDEPICKSPIEYERV